MLQRGLRPALPFLGYGGRCQLEHAWRPRSTRTVAVMWPANACAQTPFALTPFAAGCYGIGMERAANHLPPDRKANERERAYFKRLGELEEAVPKFGSRPPRQLGEVLEELARHRAQWPMLPQTDDLAEHLAEREAMMTNSDAGHDEDVCDVC